MKEISPNTFLSFSDDLKLKMINQQFAFPEEQFHEVRRWLIDNTNYPYLIDELKIPNEGGHIWVKFVDETDAIAFKLAWM